jgi:hypothetical protein
LYLRLFYHPQAVTPAAALASLRAAVAGSFRGSPQFGRVATEVTSQVLLPNCSELVNWKGVVGFCVRGLPKLKAESSLTPPEPQRL